MRVGFLLNLSRTKHIFNDMLNNQINLINLEVANPGRPLETLKPSGKPFNPASLEKLSGIEITVMPNPAKDWAAFNYTLPENATSGVIVISDASGREVASMPVNGRQGQQIWDTRAVKPGVYFYTLSAGGFSKHGKIVISK